MPEHPLACAMRLDPVLCEHIRKTEELVYADGALPRKTKLLIAMAFDAAHGTANGVRALAGQAMQAGATKEKSPRRCGWPATWTAWAACTWLRRD